jgi:hypothetical protein
MAQSKSSLWPTTFPGGAPNQSEQDSGDIKMPQQTVYVWAGLLLALVGLRFLIDWSEKRGD